MAKVKSLMMDLQEEFYTKALPILKDCDSIWEAQKKVEKLRKAEYNWLDQFAIAEEVEIAWNAS
tara:strand:+ start:220 stop:411 length:192 start_codon:yes stop_codon:yes gene_type:complete